MNYNNVGLLFIVLFPIEIYVNKTSILTNYSNQWHPNAANSYFNFGHSVQILYVFHVQRGSLLISDNGYHGYVAAAWKWIVLGSEQEGRVSWEALNIQAYNTDIFTTPLSH